jgi:hypothetical protein
MSSKKARRRKRREKQEEERRKGLSTATLFILGIGVALILTVVGGMVLGGDSGPGDPPRPGAVWSEAHGHWH